MKIIKKNKYALIALLLFTLDFGLTWFFIYNDSHHLEGNPLFQIDGGYLALAINFLYLIVIFLIEKLILNKYETIVIEASSGLDYYKKLYKTDRSNYIITSISFAFIFSTFASRISAIIDWVIFGIYRGNYPLTKYALIREKMPFHRYDVTIAFLSFFIFVILWYKIEYKKSKQVSNTIGG